MTEDDPQEPGLPLRLYWVISRAFWHPRSVFDRIRESLPARSRKSRWPQLLVDRLFAGLGLHPAPSSSQLYGFLITDEAVCRILERLRRIPQFDFWVNGERFLPHPIPEHLNVPSLTNRNELARLLRVSHSALAAFCKQLQMPAADVARHQHYHYRWLTKRYGAYRLIEAPKERLKEIQRRILTEILEHVPSHPAAAGFVKGRSLRDAVAMHVGRDVLLRIDLKDFFPSMGIGKVRQLFRFLGYPSGIADDLARLCTNTTPAGVLSALPESNEVEVARLASTYRLPHLPQGAPTSPALSNLLAFRLDARLARLAHDSVPLTVGMPTT